MSLLSLPEIEEIDVESVDDDALTDGIDSFSRSLCFFREEEQYGDVAHTAIVDGDKALFLDNFCWCDRQECPLCNVHLEDISAHQALRLRPLFRARGHVLGHGAPNLLFRDPEAGIDFRVWWYKRIGRSMAVYSAGDLSWTDIAARLGAFAHRHRRALIRASAERWADLTFPCWRDGHEKANQEVKAAIAAMDADGLDLVATLLPLVPQIARLPRASREIEGVRQILDLRPGASPAR